MQWNYDLDTERKRLKEQDFLENNSQISSVDFLQPPSVSTGLGLSFDNVRLASTGDSALLSLVGDDIDHELQQHDVEIDRFLKVQVSTIHGCLMSSLPFHLYLLYKVGISSYAKISIDAAYF